MGEFENKVEDLGPMGERSGGLEEDGGLDDCFSAEEAAKVMIALFLSTQDRSRISTIALSFEVRGREHTCPVSLPVELDCDSQIFSASAMLNSADSLGAEKI